MPVQKALHSSFRPARLARLQLNDSLECHSLIREAEWTKARVSVFLSRSFQRRKEVRDWGWQLLSRSSNSTRARSVWRVKQTKALSLLLTCRFSIQEPTQRSR